MEEIIKQMGELSGRTEVDVERLKLELLDEGHLEALKASEYVIHPKLAFGVPKDQAENFGSTIHDPTVNITDPLTSVPLVIESAIILPDSTIVSTTGATSGVSMVPTSMTEAAYNPDKPLFLRLLMLSPIAEGGMPTYVGSVSLGVLGQPPIVSLSKGGPQLDQQVLITESVIVSAPQSVLDVLVSGPDAKMIHSFAEGDNG